MYTINSTAYGRAFTTTVGANGIVITEGFNPVVGRNLEEFISNFAQAYNRSLKEVRTELAHLIEQIKEIIAE